MVTSVTRMEIRSEVTDVILNITLEIIHLLTGEDYTVVKKSGECVIPSSYPNVSRGWNRVQRPIMEEPLPQSMIHDKNNDQKILELTNKIIELLTGEVPVRCQDVTVHFSMEEWEYLEGNRDLYKDIMIENHQPLTSPGRLHENAFSHEQVSCFSGQSNLSSWSHLKNEKTTKNDTKVSCDLGTFNYISNYAPTNRRLNPYSHIMEEPISCNGRTISNTSICTPTDNKQYPSTDILEGPISCDEENLTDLDIYTATDPTQYNTSPYIKEKPVSCDDDLAKPSCYIPTDHLQYASPHIKEEPVSCDEDLTEPKCYTPTDYLQYPSPHIKEEPVSCDEDLTEPNGCTPTDHLQYPSPHIKEELVSCDDPNSCTPPNHTLQQQYAEIKIEPDFDNGENITQVDIYIPRDHVQYPSTHVKEEPGSCDGGNITCCNSHTTADHIQQYPITHIKEELVSSYVRDFTDPNRSHTQYQSTLIKKEPVSCRGNTKYLFALPHEGPITSQLGYHKETDLYTASDHTQNFQSTSVKDNIFEQHSPTLGDTDVKRENSPTPMKVIVLAHLVDVDQAKPGSTNNKRVNSQSQECFASTSNHVKHEIKQKIIPFGIRSSSVRTPEGGQTFGDISNLTKYSRAHSRKKTPQCSECGQYFLRKVQLDAHLRMHAKYKSFQCSDCGKYFLDNVQLLDRKKHPGETKYKCPVCRKHFHKQPNHLTNETDHNGGKPFQCPECGKCFRLYYQLYIHKKTHTEDVKCSCSSKTTVKPHGSPSET